MKKKNTETANIKFDIQHSAVSCFSPSAEILLTQNEKKPDK